MKVKLFAEVREVAGFSEVEVCLKDGSSLIDVLNELSEKLGEGFREKVIDEKMGIPRGGYKFSLNGVIMQEVDLRMKLKDGDVLAILPPVSGG
ncbi:MAG: MoaD/ThiS family protein [Candidatus Asgardarchaeia archaeon]